MPWMEYDLSHCIYNEWWITGHPEYTKSACHNYLTAPISTHSFGEGEVTRAMVTLVAAITNAYHQKDLNSFYRQTLLINIIN